MLWLKIVSVPAMIVVEVFADICCTFTHVGLHTLTAARDERGLDLRFHLRAWPLEWVNGALPEAAAIGRQVEALRSQVAPHLFGGFRAEALPSTTIPALGLAINAYCGDIGRGEAVSLALRGEVFERGRDVSDPRVLAGVASGAGVAVPAPEAAESLVRADYEEGQRRGVIGSPHFFTPDGESLFCPSLQIAKGDDGRLQVDLKPGAVDALLDRCA